MTKIVGHRGAQALELENTIKGFKLALELGIDAIELDVLSTRDGKIVVCHDDNLKRLSGQKAYVSRLNYSELAEIHLHNNETIPLLYDVLALLKGMPIVLDIRTKKFIPEIMRIIGQYPDLDITIVTWQRSIIKECKRLRPDIPVLIERYVMPGFMMWSVRKYGADGLNLHHIWLNPFVYRSLQKQGKYLQVYTINNLRLARLIKRLYPNAWICTNHPNILKKSL